MIPNADGLWHVKIYMVPGTYEYKYVINGERWIKDPGSRQTVGDGYWGENSIVTVTKRQTDVTNAT